MITALQLVLLAGVLAVIAERAYVLFYRAPVSSEALSALLRAVSAGDAAWLMGFAAERPQSFVGRLLVAVHPPAGSDAESPDEALSALRYAATERLMLLRALATLASTLGLLAGIVALVQGFSSENAGLLALEAGLSQRVGVTRALRSMALGVGTSGLCFFALSRLRLAVRELVHQTVKLGRALGVEKS